MPTLTENKRAGAHVLFETSPNYSRESVTVSGGNYKPATVMGKVTASGKFKQLNTAGADGTQTAVAVLFAGVDASAVDKTGIVNDAATVVRAADLVWPAGITDPQKTAAIASLRAQGIKVR